MAYDLSVIGSYTTAEKLQAVDHAIMTVLLGGQVLGIGGRSMTRADLDSLRELRAELVAQQTADETSSDGGNVLVVIGERL